MKQSHYNTAMTVIRYSVLSFAAFISLFPFIWMLIAATNSNVAINSGSMMIGSELGNNLTKLFNPELGFTKAIFNSAIIALITTFFALLISSAAGYGFEIFKSKKRDIVFGILLVSMMVPFCALMVPLFRLFGSFGTMGFDDDGNPLAPWKWLGLDTYFAVVMPLVATAFLIFLFRQNTKAFPKDILEAARIDGLSEIAIFFKMYFPVMRPTYAAAAIITFMGSWNNFLWPLVALQTPEMRTVPLVLSNMGSSYTPDFGMIMCGIVIATLPTAAIFFLMQKYFVAGMVGAVK
ncbi:carbohydrate ABC transporter permease [Anaerobiospirillum sp. NML120448]|uniref:carbohydrate ABC transporter permease n=1 Tax=Anaerobiospirillum sp. NML120448 TaxID=2932816 RepID=UPI001FF249F3|nr:carbohydrate ABC transporter permease [Anaerobiospirillum sp. NML120448]MCK0514525.1 carbohydrate ABC transporter permease [Anaerobiospirillum sp. NML120448]